ncbi:hypothetical protein [Desertibacillus haloalkaliphilus]|uniref:hypothetical protein n=1 Tax=Desertibacillus haloalkaliphilus TaxID=1328930 RepID=UPI001C2521EC|nr:hypothetical protein [Desertibacillus haloalkaliphilus]MBU8906583.1 hypothetical protein [Desertibacillus haloalkaliphilus]
MKKTTLISVVIVAVLVIGLFSFIKLNPPLASGTIGSTSEKQGVLISIGNKGFSNIKINDVLINNHEEPLDKKIQLSNPLKGFYIAADFDGEAKEFDLTDIEDVSIEPNTAPSSQLDKVNDGTATEDDKSYGLSVINNEEINEVIIHYSYLGLSFEKVIPIRF